MPGRWMIRKRILYLILIAGCFLLFLNLHQKTIWSFYTDTTMPDWDRSKFLQKIHRGRDVWTLGSNVVLEHINDFQNSYQSSNDNSPSDEAYSDAEGKPWFFRGGTRRPSPAKINPRTNRRRARLWPHEDPKDDRIVNQLMFKPPTISVKNPAQPQRLKKILFYYGLTSWNLKAGREAFLNAKCPVDTCTITASAAEAPHVDAIVYKDRFTHPGHMRPPRQVWILYYLECPYHTQHVKYNDMINWTATYRWDSDIVTPYEKWTYYNPKVKQKVVLDRNYAANKTKHVAWFVSNCAARNNRLHYAHKLSKYIPVHIYGSCGDKKCPRFPNDSNEKCFQMLDHDYKFYLAFENSNCRDYITEKLFVNGLGRNILPIVMGAHPDDYAKSAPEHSYIHVDDFKSPKELAQYLHKLDKDDELYNSYFRWKGTGEFINTYFLCRLCAMLHDDYPAKSYRDINQWWRGRGICTQSSWRDSKSKSIYES